MKIIFTCGVFRVFKDSVEVAKFKTFTEARAYITDYPAV